jgi:hypothetical protein
MLEVCGQNCAMQHGESVAWKEKSVKGKNGDYAKFFFLPFAAASPVTAVTGRGKGAPPVLGKCQGHLP